MSVTLGYPWTIKHFSLRLGLSHTKSPFTTLSQGDIRQTGQGTQVEITYRASQRHVPFFHPDHGPSMSTQEKTHTAILYHQGALNLAGGMQIQETHLNKRLEERIGVLTFQRRAGISYRKEETFLRHMKIGGCFICLHVCMKQAILKFTVQPKMTLDSPMFRLQMYTTTPTGPQTHENLKFY